jgi:hypothetical protein
MMNAVNCYGWVVPATILTLLFFAVLIFICWQFEDIPLETDIFKAPQMIFSWARKKWQISPSVGLIRADD